MAGNLTQYYQDFLARREQEFNDYINSAVAPADDLTYEQFGDGGYIDSTVNGLLSGIGSSLEGTGTYLNQHFGIGETMADFGSAMAEGRAPTRQWGIDEITDDPLGFITDPSGLVYTASNITGSAIPDVALTAGATAAMGATGGAAAPVAAGLLGATRLGRALSVGGKVLGKAAPYVAGGAMDASSEAGNAYLQAVDQGMSQDRALEAADRDFFGNIALSSVQNAASMNLFRGAGGVAGRILGRSADDVAENVPAKSGIMGAISEYGGKVADFADKNYATRLAAYSLPNQAIEGYTEGLQNEIQNWAINDSQINYNPFNMSDESQDQMAAAFFGMAPMGAVGAIGRRRARQNTPIEATPEEVQQNVSAQAPTTPVSPDMSGTMVEGEINPEDMEPVQVEKPSGGVDVTDLNNRIQAYIANPSEYDKAENALYANGDEAGFAYMQARANMLTENPEATFGYNPVSGTKKMSNEDMKSIARTLLQSEDNPDINTEDKAEQMAKLLKVRNDNLYARNRANQVIQQKRDLGMEVSQAELDNAQKVSPDTGFITADRDEIKAAIKANKATAKENRAKGTQMMLDSFKNDGERSDFFLGEDGTMSSQGIERLANFGLTPESKAVKNLATRESNKIRQAQSQKVTETVSAIKPGIIKDIRTNRAQSKYFSPNGKLSPAVDKELRDAFGGKVDSRITNAITAESKAVLEKERKQSDKNNKDRMVLDDQLQKANKINTGENFGIKVDTSGFANMKAYERATKLDQANGRIEARRKQADLDAIEGFERVREVKINDDPATSPVVAAMAKRAKNPKTAAKAIAKQLDKFLNYNKTFNVNDVVSKYTGKNKDIAREAFTKYANNIVTGKYSQEEMLADIENSFNGKTQEAQSEAKETRIEPDVKKRSISPDKVKTEPKAEEVSPKKDFEKQKVSNLLKEGTPHQYVKDVIKARVDKNSTPETVANSKKEAYKISQKYSKELRRNKNAKTINNTMEYLLNPEKFKAVGKQVGTLVKKFKGDTIPQANGRNVNVVSDILDMATMSEESIISSYPLKLTNAQRAAYTDKEIADAQRKFKELKDKYQKASKQKADERKLTNSAKKRNVEVDPAEDYSVSYEGGVVQSSKFSADVTINSNQITIDSFGEGVVTRDTAKASDEEISDYLQNSENLSILDSELERSDDGKTIYVNEAQYLVTKDEEGGKPLVIPQFLYDKLSDKDKAAFIKDGGKVDGKKPTPPDKGGKNNVSRPGMDSERARETSAYQSRSVESNGQGRTVESSRGMDGRTASGVHEQGVRQNAQNEVREANPSDLTEAFRLTDKNISDKFKNNFVQEQFKHLTEEEKTRTADAMSTGGLLFKLENKAKKTGYGSEVYAETDMNAGEISIFPTLKENYTSDDHRAVAAHEFIHYVLSSLVNTNVTDKKTAMGNRDTILNKLSDIVRKKYKGQTIKDRGNIISKAVQELADAKWNDSDPAKQDFGKAVYGVFKEEDRAILDGLIQRIVKDTSPTGVFSKLKSKQHYFHEVVANKAIADKIAAQDRLANLVMDEDYWDIDNERMESIQAMPVDNLLSRLKNGYGDKPGNQKLYEQGVKIVKDGGELYNFILDMALKNNKEALTRYKAFAVKTRQARLLKKNDSTPNTTINTSPFASESQKRIADNEGIRPPDNATRLAVFWSGFKGLFTTGGRRGGMSFWSEFLDNPRYVFEKYWPKAMHVYDLAQKSRLKLEDAIARYNQRYLEIFAGLSKESMNKVEQLILYADEAMRDPMQVIELDNGKFAAIDYDGYVEHFEDNKEAVLRLNELRESGEYKYATSIAERPDDATGKSGNVTVIALSKNSKLFSNRKDAEKYAESMFNEATRQAIEDMTGQAHTMSQAKEVISRYRKFRKFMDDIWGESSREALKTGAPVPPKRYGYFPHMHLPYVVYEKRVKEDSTADWVKVNSFYTPREAARYTEKLVKEGKEAQYVKISPIDNLALQQQYGTNERLTASEIEDMKANELINTRDDEYEDYTNHNGALKSELSRYFQKSNTISIEKAMKAVQSIQSRKPGKNNPTLRKAQMQIKSTGIFKKLQRMKKDTITKEELYTILNEANMRYKFNPHFIAQTNASGFSRNVRETTYRYMMRQANYVAKAEFFAEATNTYTELTHLDFYKDAPVTDRDVFLHEYIKAVNNLTSVTAVDRMIDRAFSDVPLLGTLYNRFIGSHPYMDFASRAIQTNNILKLGLLNPSSAIVQLSQLLNANAKLGGNKFIGLSKYFRKGMDAAFIKAKESDKKYKDLYEYCGITDETVALDSEMIGKRPGMLEKKWLAGKSLTDLANSSMVFFNWGDRKARKATAIGGYLKAQDVYAALGKEQKDKLLKVATDNWNRKRESAKVKELKFKAPKPTAESVREEYCLKYARNLVNDTNFNYSVTDTPLLLTKLGVTGKLLFQFQKYPLFTLNFIKHNTAEENVRFIVPLLLLAGCMGLPCADAVDEVSELVSGKKPTDYLKEQAILWAGKDPAKKAIANVALYGTPTLAGINLSTRIGLEGAIPTEIGGPTLNTAQDILSGKNPVTAMAPRLGGFKAAFTGQYENSSGNLVTNLSVYDRALKVLGFKPMTETNASDASGALYRKTQEYRDNLAKAKKEFIEDPNPSTREALRIYGMSNKEINKLLLTKDSTSIEKQLKSIPKKSKSEDAQKLQALAEIVQG